jgi:nitrate/nitrite transporter NarK
MDKLAVFNIIGVAATALLALTAGILGLAAVASGQVQAIPLLPQWHLFGDTPVKIAMAMAGVIPVVLNCYVGHQSVFSVMKMLQPYTSGGMKGVVAAALGGSAAIFFVLALGSIAAFGGAVDPNILNNLSKGSMAALLGDPLAQVRAQGYMWLGLPPRTCPH